MMRLRTSGKLLQPIAWLIVIVVIGAGAFVSRDQWYPPLNDDNATDETASTAEPANDGPKMLKLSPQARANLDLASKPATLRSYWRKVQIPGVLVDRPGVTDRGITAPIAGVVTQVHAFEGDIIRPGEKLFSLRLVSESLQQTQSQLFNAIRETEIIAKERARISGLAELGVIPGKRVLELNHQTHRQAALIDAHRQDLLSRGLVQTQIDRIEAGKFLTSIEVSAPMVAETADRSATSGIEKNPITTGNSFFEVQELRVDLGQQVDVGQAMAVLANHNSLYVRGHAFRKEASSLARAAENDWNVDVEFIEDSAFDWPPIDQSFQIRHLSNTTDPNSRTFDFFIPLTNQSRVYKKDDRPFVIWRFRPGQRVRIQVPVEEITDVFVLPAAAVFQEGPEAWVFQQNGDLFNRLSVQIVHQDRLNAVIANDGSITPGFYLAQGSAASLNRVLKAQAASGMRADVHVHADGTTHAAH